MSLVRLQRVFERDPSHLSAFLVLGDPTPDISVELAVAAIDAGVSMLELGLPFSDPCADGPAIERSCLRARRAGVSTEAACEVMAAIHAARPEVPFNLLVYGNLVHAPGADAFCERIARAGASSLLVPDIPMEEAADLRTAVSAHGMGHVSLVGPRTSASRLQQIAEQSSGFLYLAGYQGVTGKAVDAAESTTALVERTVRAVDLPICLGFGISTAEQVASAFDAGARIAVVGSHLARAIESACVANEPVDAGAVRGAFLTSLEPLLASLHRFEASKSSK